MPLTLTMPKQFITRFHKDLGKYRGYEILVASEAQYPLACHILVKHCNFVIVDEYNRSESETDTMALTKIIAEADKTVMIVALREVESLKLQGSYVAH